jgi:hypothetical protein
MRDWLEDENGTQQEPIPLYPRLANVLGSVTMAAIVAYLEIHHPHPGNDSQASTGRSSAPFSIRADTLCEAIGVNRRTLQIALSCIAVWWRAEELRAGAARSGREFLNSAHTRYGKVKLYSVVGSKSHKCDQTLTFRRNYGRINQALTQAGIERWPETMQQVLITHSLENSTSASSSPVLTLPQIIQESLRIRVRNGWTEERREAQSAKMREIWEIRKKSGWARK